MVTPPKEPGAFPCAVMSELCLERTRAVLCKPLHAWELSEGLLTHGPLVPIPRDPDSVDPGLERFCLPNHFPDDADAVIPMRWELLFTDHVLRTTAMTPSSSERNRVGDPKMARLGTIPHHLLSKHKFSVFFISGEISLGVKGQFF